MGAVRPLGPSGHWALPARGPFPAEVRSRRQPKSDAARQPKYEADGNTSSMRPPPTKSEAVANLSPRPPP